MKSNNINWDEIDSENNIYGTVNNRKGYSFTILVNEPVGIILMVPHNLSIYDTEYLFCDSIDNAKEKAESIVKFNFIGHNVRLVKLFLGNRKNHPELNNTGILFYT